MLLFLANAVLKTKIEHMIPHKNDNARSEIDHILFGKGDRKIVRDVQLIPSEVMATQNRLLIADIILITEKEMPEVEKTKLLHLVLTRCPYPKHHSLGEGQWKKKIISKVS